MQSTLEGMLATSSNCSFTAFPGLSSVAIMPLLLLSPSHLHNSLKCKPAQYTQQATRPYGHDVLLLMCVILSEHGSLQTEALSIWLPICVSGSV